jgi:hypothetical protein
MRHTNLPLRACLLAGAWARTPLIVSPRVLTEPLYNYEDAPATPDADDPASG